MYFLIYNLYLFGVAKPLRAGGVSHSPAKAAFRKSPERLVPNFFICVISMLIS